MKRCVRVREGGEVRERIELDQSCFACMLGGDDGRTVFMMAAERRDIEHCDRVLRSRTGQVLTLKAQGLQTERKRG